MRVALLNITNGGLSGGYLKYLSNLVPLLIKNDRISDLLLSLPSTGYLEQFSNEFADIPLLLLERSFGLRTVNVTTMNRLKEFKPDVIFIPTARYFKLENVPVVCMVRNMLPMTSIENNPFHEKIRNYIQNNVARNAAKNSTRVIAVSRYVQEFLQKRWNIPRERIGLVYHGIEVSGNEEIRHPDIIPDKIKHDFIFTAGAIEPYRGLEDIIMAMRKLDVDGTKAQLLIAGDAREKMKPYAERLKQLTTKYKLNDSIYWVGKLTEEEMGWCYKNCSMFIMSSRVEACPNIALEAMAHGCLILAADNPPLPEFFKETVIYYPPRQEKHLARVIQEILKKDDKRVYGLAEKAKDRASEFSWHLAAEKTIDELSKAGQ